MQILLPYENLIESVSCLSTSTLRVHRARVYSLLEAILRDGSQPMLVPRMRTPWAHHPLFGMWQHSPELLLTYGLTCCLRYSRRGNYDWWFSKLWRLASSYPSEFSSIRLRIIYPWGSPTGMNYDGGYDIRNPIAPFGDDKPWEEGSQLPKSLRDVEISHVPIPEWFGLWSLHLNHSDVLAHQDNAFAFHIGRKARDVKKAGAVKLWWPPERLCAIQAKVKYTVRFDFDGQ